MTSTEVRQILDLIRIFERSSENAVRHAEDALRGARHQRSHLRHIKRLLLSWLQREFNHALAATHPEWVRVDADLPNGTRLCGWIVGGARKDPKKDSQTTLIWFLQDREDGAYTVDLLPLVPEWHSNNIAATYSRAVFAVPQVADYIASMAPGEVRPVASDWKRLE